MPSKVDPYVRAPYELYTCLSWLGGVCCFLAGYLLLPDGSAMAWPCAGYGLLAAHAAAGSFKLMGRGKLDMQLPVMGAAELAGLTSPTHLWFGWGFKWGQVHSQRALDFMLSGIDSDFDREYPGSPWIHGVNHGAEEAVKVPLRSLEGHTLLFGTTGAGKTRAFEVMVTQSIHRGDTVILIDPKGDKELMERMRGECLRAGRDDAFLYFHPGFPTLSVRIDPMRNFTRATELASRVAALLPASGGTSDTFTAFAFRALNLVAQGLIETGERPSIRLLRQYIEGGAEPLLVNAIIAHADRVNPEWREEANHYVAWARAGKGPHMETIHNAEWLGIIAWYKARCANTQSGSEGIDGLLSIVEHNRLHFSKMVASLIPVLNILTSGELGLLLSPNERDILDKRPIFDSSSVIMGNRVLYIGLDSLSDAMVASAIGSLLLSDFASFAGQMYNGGIKAGRVSVYVDESAEVVNAPFIQILNKGRGAGFQVTMAAQTFPDFVSRLGDEAKARQILGNCNNLVCLRVKDGETQKYVVEAFGNTYVQTVQSSMSSSMDAAENVLGYSGGTGKSLAYSEQDLFPQHLLGQLPNFHYIASLQGGMVVKGRLPLLQG